MKKIFALPFIACLLFSITISAQKAIPELQLLPRGNNVSVLPKTDSIPKKLLQADSSKIRRNPNYHPDWINAPKTPEIHWYALENKSNKKYWENVYSDKLLIEFKKRVSIEQQEVRLFLRKSKLDSIIHTSMFPEIQNYYTFYVKGCTKQKMLSIIKRAKKLHNVLYAEPLPIIKTKAYIPNDPYFFQNGGYHGQWDMTTIRVDSVWGYFQGGSKNLLAVVDDAVDYSHPDLVNQVRYGYDFVYSDNDPSPDVQTDDHGTHVTGTVAAEINNGIGVAGMTNDTIYFAKISDGSALDNQAILDAINYISTIPRIKAVNMSYGAYGYSQAELTAYSNAWNSGKVLIAAAGNDNLSTATDPHYPSSFNNYVISVASVGVNSSNQLVKATYSNYGSDIDISAPGGEDGTGWQIYSTLPSSNYGGTGWVGTSMASPHVNGLAGIIAATNPFLTNVGIRSILEQEVFDLGTVGYDQYFGYGMICAWCAFEEACNQFTISITANGGTTVCSGGSVTLNAPYNDNIDYQWRRNGTNISGAINNSYVATQAGAYSLYAQTAGNCYNTSNSISVSVNPIVSPSVNISANPSGAICAGSNVTFTASPVNGGVSPSYQWKVNGSNVGSNSPTFSSSSLANGNTVTCVLTSSASCVSPTTATSNGITMSVNSIVTPTISITANPSGAICSGTSVTYNATITNGGTSPSYQWKKSGSNVGSNSATFTTSTLANGNVITCVLTSNVSCPTSTTATSNGITMTVNPTVTPSVSITANPSGAICSGTSVTFIASPTNGGTPSYQWKVNGSNVGTNSSVFSSSTLTNGNVVSCILTSNATCVSPTTANSNNITMSVSSSVTPSVNITANPSGTVCPGTSITFTATPSGGGTTPSYQWKVNGGNVGSNSPTFSTATLVNGDFINVILNSNASCASPQTAASNTLTAVIWGPPSAFAGDDITITQGDSTILTATGGGTYLWSNGSTSQSITVSPLQTTTYTVTVTDVHTCTASDNVTVSVQLACNNVYTLSSPSANVPALGGNCSTDITTDAACTWNVNTGGCIGWVTTNNPSGSGSANISFTVQPNTLPSQRTCFTTLAGNLFQIIQAAAITDIQELSAIKNISVFPNPNNGEFTLSIESVSTQKVNANVFNSLGQLILKREVETNTQTEFDLSVNAKGIYYLQLQSVDRNYYVKVSVE